MLTDIKCRTEKAVGDKEKKISDGFGLYLLVKPSGAELWQMAYRFSGRQKKLSFGIYGSDDEGPPSNGLRAQSLGRFGNRFEHWMAGSKSNWFERSISARSEKSQEIRAVSVQ